ncbi:MAG: radical protein [Bacteroidota bacterium]|nr:radical protein [Bacteroidota bacterium]
MKTEVSYHNKKFVLQPTSICNLNCEYCYLPGRDILKYLNPQVCTELANYINSTNDSYEIIWHGGEPLACGLKRFSELFLTFKNCKCKHTIQSNATLINNEWCNFFKKNNVSVGISIDGSKLYNKNRINWNGAESYDSTMKGIKTLLSHNINFSVISVISEKHLDHAKELYDYFLNLGCWSWGLNIEEFEGSNTRSNHFNSHKIKNFWKELYYCWQSNPKIRIREFDYALTWMDRVCNQPEFEVIKRDFELFPSISCNGDMVLLSPEFLDVNILGHNFIIGNVLVESIESLLKNLESYTYIREFTNGILKCADECDYFSFCGGGYASNKFFENGSLNTTITQHCHNSKKTLIDTITKII